MSKEEYKSLMLRKLEERRIEIVAKRRENGQGFAGKENLRKTKAGAEPSNTKTSHRHTKRPLVLTLCAETRRRYVDWYFGIVAAYKEASKRFRAGELDVKFPTGTYRPPCTIL